MKTSKTTDTDENVLTFQVENPAATGSKIKAIVIVTRTQKPIGTIGWSRAWRQFAFTPGPRAVFNRRVLEEIAARLQMMMHDWRKARG